MRDYCYENGRRYHAYRHGQYPIPNDEEEQDRLALMHHLFKLLTGGDLYRAPIRAGREPRRILDIGTGTGAWALEMAEDFPNADVIGTDLSPIQPNWAPPNCTFHVDDAESDWTFAPDEAFDYIHARSLGGGIADWERLLCQAYQHLKPGGWLELQEYETWVRSDDGTHEQATMLLDWQQKLDQGSRQFGKRMNVASDVAEWMQDAGFVNVTDDVYKVPPPPNCLVEKPVNVDTVPSRLLAKESSTKGDRAGGQMHPLGSRRALHLGPVHAGHGVLL